jgi:hypothetical protein
MRQKESMGTQKGKRIEGKMESWKRGAIKSYHLAQEQTRD